MKWKICLLLTSFLILGLAVTAHAHGARIEYTLNMTIEIQATYDNGEPMAEAQVTVYAPNDLTTPWMTGVCDDEGRFAFTPDASIPGTWDVQVRQAGHGDIVHIPVGKEGATSGSTGYTALQYVLMGATTVWGFVGTALFVSSRRLAKGEA